MKRLILIINEWYLLSRLYLLGKRVIEIGKNYCIENFSLELP